MTFSLFFSDGTCFTVFFSISRRNYSRGYLNSDAVAHEFKSQWLKCVSIFLFIFLKAKLFLARIGSASCNKYALVRMKLKIPIDLTEIVVYEFT